MKEQIFDVTKTATIAEEFGPEQAKAETSAKVGRLVKELCEAARDAGYSLTIDIKPIPQ